MIFQQPPQASFLAPPDASPLNNWPQRLSDHLSSEEKRAVATLLGPQDEIVASGVAEFLEARGSEWQKVHVGIVCYIKDHAAREKLVVMMNPCTEPEATLLFTSSMRNVAESASHPHPNLVTFAGTTLRHAAFNFLSAQDASSFMRIFKQEASKRLSASHPPSPALSKVSPVSKQSNSSADSGIYVSAPLTKKKTSKSFFSSLLGGGKERKEKKEKKRKKKNDEFLIQEGKNQVNNLSREASSAADSAGHEYKQFKQFYTPPLRLEDVWKDSPSTAPLPPPLLSLPSAPSPSASLLPSSSLLDGDEPSSPLSRQSVPSLNNAACRNSIRMTKTSAQSRRATPKEIKSQSELRRLHSQSALLSPPPITPLHSSHTPPPVIAHAAAPTQRGPLPPLPRDDSPPPLPPSRSAHASPPPSSPPDYPPPPLPSSLPPPLSPAPPEPRYLPSLPSESPQALSDPISPAVASSPPPLPSAPSLSHAVLISPLSSPPPPPPPSAPQSLPPIKDTSKGSSTSSEPDSLPLDLLSQIRSVDRHSLLRSSVSDRETSQAQAARGSGIADSIQKAIDKRRTALAESSSEDEESSSGDSDWSD